MEAGTEKLGSSVTSREHELVAVIRELVGELHPQRAKLIDVSPPSRLERDLGIDSLGRTELILRIERTFRVRLPGAIVGEAETVGDLLGALEQAIRITPVAWKRPRRRLSPGAGGDAMRGPCIEVLEWHVARDPDRLHVTVLQDDATMLATLTYRELAEAARAFARRSDRARCRAGRSQRADAADGPRLLGRVFRHPLCRRRAGADLSADAAVAARGSSASPDRHSANAGARVAGHVARRAPPCRTARGAGGEPDRHRERRRLSPLRRRRCAIASVTGETSIALIQYTSGSTGDPKGVVLSHANLLANIRAMGRAMEASSADIFVSWLPLYHDMGLIGAWLGCLLLRRAALCPCRR